MGENSKTVPKGYLSIMIQTKVEKNDQDIDSKNIIEKTF